MILLTTDVKFDFQKQKHCNAKLTLSEDTSIPSEDMSSSNQQAPV